MVKSMVKVMLTRVFRFYRSFSLVKVLCNGPLADAKNSPPPPPHPRPRIGELEWRGEGRGEGGGAQVTLEAVAHPCESL